MSRTRIPPRLVDSIQQGSLRYSYKAVPTSKDPFDLALYSLLLWQTKPRTIVEIGTHRGGSALWLADQMTAFGIGGQVHSLDIRRAELAADPRIVLHIGDARRVGETFPADWIAAQPRPLLVIDDGDHSYQSVLAVLDHFGSQMRSGEYIVIEDGIVDELGTARKFAGGPSRAIAEFLKRGVPFEIDRSYCDFYGRNVTWNIDGYLRRL